MKKVIRIVAVVLPILIVAVVVCSYFLLNHALLTHKGAAKLANTDSYLQKNYPVVAQWKDSLQRVGALRDTFIVADDGPRLHAYYVRAASPTNHTAVVVHGYTDNALYWLPIGYMYSHDLGYNILLPDLRFAGQSEGTHIQMGWFDRLDVLRWIGVADNMFGNDLQIVVHGISMGAATTMMLSGEKTPATVRCFVEDCGYSSVWDEFEKELHVMHLPSFPLLNCASAMCSLRYGWSFSEASSVNQLKKCRKPMLFIHGDNDTYVPFSMLQKVYDAKPAPKEMWVAHGSEHALAYHDHTAEYTKVVATFVGKYIKK